MDRGDDTLEDGAPDAPTIASSRISRRSFGRTALEVGLIAVGVFLALLGDQWRENQQHRELAAGTLRRVRAEFQTNRDAVVAVKDRHVAGVKAIRAYINAPPPVRRTLSFPFNGTDPAFLEYTAWDLALATQALAYVDPDLATAIAHVYAMQRQLDGATRDITQVMYAKAGGPDATVFLSSILVYFADCTLIEPRLLAQYDSILPRLDRAIGKPGGERLGAKGP